MPDAEPKPMQDTSETSGVYRAHFRDELWSHAARDFRSPATLSKRIQTTGVHAGANGSAGDTHQPQSASAAEDVNDALGIR
jgi:hypothetical protein